MSWFLDFIAEDKAVAKRHVEASNASGSIPEEVVAALNACIDNQPDATAIKVKTNGHCGGDGAQTVNIEVNCTSMIRAEQVMPEA